MAGAAPQLTVQKRYSPVAPMVISSAPSPTSSVPRNAVYPSEKISPLHRAHQKPKAEVRRTVSWSFWPSARLIRLELPTPKRLFTALKASSTGDARVTAAFCTGSPSIPTK